MSWFVIFLRPFVVQVVGRVNKQTNKTKQNKTKQIKSKQNKNKKNKEGQHSHRPCIIMLSTGEM